MKRQWNAGCIFLLIGLYFTGAFQVESLHRILHAHDAAVAHTQEQEENSCHRAIYHFDTQKECGHASHVIVVNKCALCDVISCSHQEILPAVSFHETIHSENTVVPYFLRDTVFEISHLPARAPPVA